MSGFAGDWKIDTERSFVWDYAKKCYVPDEIGEELIRITIKDNVQDYEVLLGDGPVITLGYAARYDDVEWVPYMVRDISGFVTDDPETELADFITRTRQRKSSFHVGDVYGLVRVVNVDSRTHYRFSKDAESGAAEYTMLRRLEESGDAYVSSVLRVDGVVSTIRRFIRA